MLTSQRCHHDVQRQSEGKFAPAIPSTHVVSDTWKHTSFEDTEYESDTAGRAQGVNKGGSNRCDSKTERSGRDEPARPDPFTAHVGRNFKDDIADIEDGQELVVVVTLHVEVLFETSKSGIANVGSVDEAE